MPYFMGKLLASDACGEGGDDITLSDLRQGVPILGEALDVVPERLALVLRAKVNVPLIPRSLVGALEVIQKKLLEFPPVPDAARCLS